MELQNLSIPHSGIYKRGISPSKFPQTFLPTVPYLQRKISSTKDNLLERYIVFDLLFISETFVVLFQQLEHLQHSFLLCLEFPAKAYSQGF